MRLLQGDDLLHVIAEESHAHSRAVGVQIKEMKELRNEVQLLGKLHPLDAVGAVQHDVDVGWLAAAPWKQKE